MPPPPRPVRSTPIKAARKEGSIWSAAAPNLDIKRRELRFSMHGKYIIIPTSRFLKSYMPAVGRTREGRFSDILKNIPVASGQEVKMYGPLVNALNKANICPGFKFAITYSRGDPSEKSNEAVDVGMYPSGYVPQAPKGKSKSAQNDWSFVEICIECKTEPEALDPFDDRNDDKQPTSKDRKGVLGQILSYAEFVLTRQQRTCLFMVLLLGDLCRLVRFDRSGAIASEKFNYKTNGGDLIEFLWRYARCDLATRGHDPSAERIDPASNLGQRMQARATKKPADAGPEDYVRELFEKSLKTDWSWWKLRVDGEHGVVRHFLVGEPNFQAPGVAGRGTRGYVALDADNIDGQFYYLKDAWRVVSRQIDKEGKILQFLNKNGVKYIPTLECHGDIISPTIQLTKTNQLWKDLHKRKTSAVCPFKKHQHYRIVVKEVGQEMAKFERGRQLIHALWCCIFAHSEAYAKGIIHRDISAGNLLRYFDQSTGQWCGLLNDWEMSKDTSSKRPKGRQLDRTGTWQFMSAAALESPTKQIAVEDELESFFHVLLFLAIRFLQHNCDNVADFMHAYFDDFSTLNSGRYGCGARKLLCMQTGRIALKMDTDSKTIVSLLKFTWPPSADRPHEVDTRSHPMNKIIETILGWLQAHYSLMPVTSAETPAAPGSAAAAEESDEEEVLLLAGKPPRDPTELEDEQSSAPVSREAQEALAQKLYTHRAMLELLERAMHGKTKWPPLDKMKDQLPEEGYKHGADINADSTDLLKHGAQRGGTSGAGPSRKRRSDQVEQAAAQESPKRQKSATRRSIRTRKPRRSS